MTTGQMSCYRTGQIMSSQHFNLIGIAIGRVQAQYPMRAMLGGAK